MIGRVLAVVVGCGASLGLLCGCGQEQARYPSSVAEYERAQRANPQAVPHQVVILRNEQRALDGDLPVASRVESLRLVLQLAGDNCQVRANLARVLSDPATPTPVMEAMLTFLLQKDYPDLAGLVVKAMPNLKNSPALQEAVMDWLVKHPTPEVLSELVRLWAEEPANGPNEARYREVVEKVSAKAWDEALLGGINTPAFTASGSAICILQRNLGTAETSHRLASAKAVSGAMQAVQLFLQKLGYLPRGDNELAAEVQVHQAQGGTLDDVVKLIGIMKADGYEFSIRDYHLLNHLARDPSRKLMRRSELVGDIGQGVNRLKHVKYKAPTGLSIDDSFAQRVNQLSMADLWNIFLLLEMFDRPITQAAVDRMATKDRADTRTAFGGLIFYQGGQAEAVRYPPSYHGLGDDLVYVPAPSGPRGDGQFDFAADQRDSLCRFICHCEKLENSNRVGPTADELRDAKAGNYYGVVITTTSQEAFAAHYFTPTGEVISLGTYPLRR